MMTMLYAPMFAAAFFGAVWQLKAYDRMKPALNLPQMRALYAAAMTTAASGVGFILNTAVLSKRYSVVEYADMRISRFTPEGMFDQVAGIIEFFGYDAGVQLFSLRGISSCLGLLIFGIACFAVCRLFMRRKTLSAGQNYFLFTTVWGILIGMMFNVILNTLLTRYFLIALLFLVLAVFLFWETEPCSNLIIKNGALLVLLSVFAFQAQDVMHYDYKMNDVNYEIAADWLQEQGYTNGYATFWNANVLTEASDGNLEIWSLYDSDRGWKSLALYPWLQKKEHLQSRPGGKVFLLLDESEYRENEDAMLQDYYKDMIAWSYYIFEFEDADQLHEVMKKK